jgi:hypothetical protein
LIDQYVMHGGKILWLLDPLNVSMDSLQPPWGSSGKLIANRLADLFC